MIAGIKFNQQLSFRYGLIVINKDGRDRAINSGGDWVEMAIDLSVIGLFKPLSMEVPPDADGHQDEHDDGNYKSIDPTASGRRFERRRVGATKSGLFRLVLFNCRLVSLCFRAHRSVPF